VAFRCSLGVPVHGSHRAGTDVMTLFLSRLVLSKSPSAAALKSLLDPDAMGTRMDAHHRLLWSLFAGNPEEKRDFLWREEGRGVFLVLSHREPKDSELFERADVKPFAPELGQGDRLAFTLRANATKDRARADRNRRVDVVMDALHGVASGDRNEVRMSLAQTAGLSWLEAQGARAGFTVSDMTVSDYSVRVLPRHRGARVGQPQFGVLDMTGVISVDEPDAFLARLGAGFGRARAFGCGLMLIRRA
jgi:CRISPR system Cascade subunit CasE